MAVRPPTPIMIPSTTSTVRSFRRVTSARDLRVSGVIASDFSADDRRRALGGHDPAVEQLDPSDGPRRQAGIWRHVDNRLALARKAAQDPQPFVSPLSAHLA